MTKSISRARILTFFTFALAFTVHAAEWSDTEVQVLRGQKFHDNGNAIDIAKTIVTLQHASGYKYGRNFFFVDMAKSDASDGRAAEIYAEYYHTLSGSKVLSFDWSKNFLRDIGLTTGINYGTKNNAFGANPKVFLFGPTFEFNVPGFSFFNVDVLAYNDTGTFSGFGGGRLCGASSATYQVTPSWDLPFTIGNAKFSLSGFADFIGKHGSCERTLLAQPQLRWDVGNHFGKAGTAFVGFEYQYWRNKFGIKGQKDSLPQLLLVWKL